MNIGQGRPLCCLSWLFCLTVAYATCCEVASGALRRMLWISALLIVLLLVLAAAVRRIRFRMLYVSFLTLGVLLGFASSLLYQALVVAPAAPLVSHQEERVPLNGTVISQEVESGYINSYALRVDVPNARGLQADHAKVYLMTEGNGAFSVGDVICIQAEVLPVRQAREESWRIRTLLADGYTLIAYADDQSEYEVIERNTYVLGEEMQKLQHRLSYRLTQAVGGEAGKLVGALLLGTRQELSDATDLDFRRAGASHFLALSGLHLSLILLFLGFVLRLFRCPFLLRILILSACAILFLLLTGCSVSMVRATVMLLWLHVSKLLGKPHDALTPLSTFFAACLAICPAYIYDVGLWLTVLATFAIIEIVPGLFSRKNKGKKPSGFKRIWLLAPRLVWKYLLFPLLSSFMVLLVILFPMALVFEEISLMTPVSTVLMTPLTTLILAIGLILLPLLYLPSVAFLRPLCSLLAGGLKVLAQAMLDVSAGISDMRGVLISLRYDFVPAFLWILLVLLLMFLLFRWKRPRLFLPIAMAWTAAFFVCLTALRVIHVNEWQAVHTVQGKNELICLEQNELTVLCDVTDGGYTAYRALFEDGLPDATTEIEAMVLTHYHNRHISAMYQLMGDYRVRSIWLPITMPYASEEKAQQDAGIMKSIADMAAQRRVKVYYYDPLEGVSLTGTLRLERLYYEMISRSTHPTVSVCFEYISTPALSINRIFYLGASAWEGENAQELLKDMSHSDVWMLSGHGPVIKTSYASYPSTWPKKPRLLLYASEQAEEAFGVHSEIMTNIKIVHSEGENTKFYLP